MLLSRNVTSRTYSFYYPKTRPDHPRYLIVASTNANYADWANLSAEDYEASKRDLIETTLVALEKYVPRVREKIDWAECGTPVTFARYTRHLEGASFGTKFEGLAISRNMSQQIAGLYHAGSVGIIMSGWLGTVNYGVIVANEVDGFLMNNASQTPAAESP
jgi:phytoene dehydrogenase-like protein